MKTSSSASSDDGAISALYKALSSRGTKAGNGAVSEYLPSGLTDIKGQRQDLSSHASRHCFPHLYFNIRAVYTNFCVNRANLV